MCDRSEHYPRVCFVWWVFYNMAAFMKETCLAVYVNRGMCVHTKADQTNATCFGPALLKAYCGYIACR